MQTIKVMQSANGDFNFRYFLATDAYNIAKWVHMGLIPLAIESCEDSLRKIGKNPALLDYYKAKVSYYIVNTYENDIPSGLGGMLK